VHGHEMSDGCLPCLLEPRPCFRKRPADLSSLQQRISQRLSVRSAASSSLAAGVIHGLHLFLLVPLQSDPEESSIPSLHCLLGKLWIEASRRCLSAARLQLPHEPRRRQQLFVADLRHASLQHAYTDTQRQVDGTRGTSRIGCSSLLAKVEKEAALPQAQLLLQRELLAQGQAKPLRTRRRQAPQARWPRAVHICIAWWSCHTLRTRESATSALPHALPLPRRRPASISPAAATRFRCALGTAQRPKCVGFRALHLSPARLPSASLQSRDPFQRRRTSVQP
jgi:hypothetical protein